MPSEDKRCRRQKIFHFLPKLCMSSSWTTDIWSHCEAVHCLQSVGCHSSRALGRCKWPQIVNDPKITEWPNPASVSWGPQPFSCSTLKPAKLSVLWGGWEYCWYKFGWMDDFSEEWPPCRFFVGGDILALAPCSNPALLVETAKYSREQVKASRRLEKYNFPKNRIFN